MKIPVATLAGVFLLAYAVAPPSVALAAQAGTAAEKEDVVMTTGEAVVKATPDVAFVTLGVENRARTPQDAQRQTADAMTTVQQKLKAAGVAGDAVRTVSVDLSPEFDYANGRQTLRDYVARNTIEVRVDALSQLGTTIDAAVGSGATNVTSVRFDVKKRDDLEREALRQAVTQARQRAEAAASGAGRTLARIIRIEDQGTVAPPPRPVMMTARAEMVAEAATPVAPGELEIRARVMLTAALK